MLVTLAPNTATYDDQLMDGNDHTVDYRARFKNDVTTLNAPTGISSTILSTGLRITWTDTNTEESNYEIWSSLDDAAYTLIDTTVANVQTYDYTVSNAKVSIKIRAKTGTLPVYSSFSDVYTFNPSYSAEAQAVFTKITALGSSMNYVRKSLVDTYITAQKTAGLWDLTYAEWWTLEGSVNGKINIKSPDNNYLVEVGTGTPLTWTQDDGVVGSTIQNRGLNTGFNPTTAVIDKNNFAGRWYCKTNSTGVLFGGQNDATHAITMRSSIYQIFDSTSKAFTPDFSGSGALERSASNRADVFRNGTSVSNLTALSTNLANVELYLLSYNNNGSFAGPTGAKLSHFAFTQKFTTQQQTDWITNEAAYLAGL